MLSSTAKETGAWIIGGESHDFLGAGKQTNRFQDLFPSVIMRMTSSTTHAQSTTPKASVTSSLSLLLH